MTSKQSYMLLVIILVAALLGACVRSASTPPTSLVTPTSEIVSEGAPVVTNEVISQLEQFVTQTAAAAMGKGGEQPTIQPGMETPGSPGEMPTEVPVTGPTQTGGEGQPTAELVPTEALTATPQGPVPTNVIVPTSTPGIPKTYDLKPGEFPYCIARRFDVNPTELLSINGLAGGQIVRPGTTLKIPQTGNPFPGNRALLSHPTTYTVQGGENIYEIACKFGDVSPDAIAFANGLTAPYSLSPGQQLYIP